MEKSKFHNLKLNLKYIQDKIIQSFAFTIFTVLSKASICTTAPTTIAFCISFPYLFRRFISKYFIVFLHCLFKFFSTICLLLKGICWLVMNIKLSKFFTNCKVIFCVSNMLMPSLINNFGRRTAIFDWAQIKELKILHHHSFCKFQIPLIFLCQFFSKCEFWSCMRLIEAPIKKRL